MRRYDADESGRIDLAEFALLVSSLTSSPPQRLRLTSSPSQRLKLTSSAPQRLKLSLPPQRLKLSHFTPLNITTSPRHSTSPHDPQRLKLSLSRH